MEFLNNLSNKDFFNTRLSDADQEFPGFDCPLLKKYGHLPEKYYIKLKIMAILEYVETIYRLQLIKLCFGMEGT